MDLMLILTLFFIGAINASKSVSEACNNNNGSNFSTIPNRVFSDITISTVEDLITNIMHLEILVKPTTEFANSMGSIKLSSDQDSCNYTKEHSFNMNERPITIPQIGYTEEKLKPGCNYSIIFSVEGYCTYRFYRIPERKPCQNYSPEDVFNSFPNRVINNVTVNAFRKNATRLNILFSPKPEFANYSGTIVVNSKMSRCNHPEEFSFSLDETNLTIPRAELPHSFIAAGCEYMIDFEIMPYCVTTTYKVPDFCLGNEPQAEILDVIEENDGIYKVLWDAKVSKRNKTYSIVDIFYRIDNVSDEVFNSKMDVQNQYQLNYSMLNMSRVPRGRTYRLAAIFVSDDQCSNKSYTEFRISANNRSFLLVSAVAIVIFAAMSMVCLYVPTFRSRIVVIFKLLFGISIKDPVQITTSKYTGMQGKEEINLDYVPLELENCDDFEFPRSRLNIEPNNSPRKGNFGIVYFGRAFGLNKTKGSTTVAIKTLRDDAPADEVESMIEEINTMKKIASFGSNENVVKMLGCCTIQKPHMIILELVACGDLQTYLVDLRKEWSVRKNRSRFLFPDDGSNGLYIFPSNGRTLSESSSNCVPSPTETECTMVYDDTDESLLSVSASTPIKKIIPALSNIELQNFALQISKGMAFLESISVVHRDLAARNVLINEMKILKISDFGMSRIGDYVHSNTGQQPLRWMAPESIEKFTCTSKSDVWSFGVVLWEIGTLGAFPYDSVPNHVILEYLLYSLKKGIRLMRPEICTDELYSLMLKCWSENPVDRPSFQQIVDHLSEEKKKIYLDFQKLNPAYVFPPTKFS